MKRADWRFLLPAPPGGAFRHLVLLGGSPTLADLVLKLGIAHHVSREIPPQGGADALVVLQDAGVDLPDACACLSAGGVVYWEVERRWGSILRSTPGAIRRRLRESGLTPLALYWPRPDFSRTTMYLPIGPRGVFAWCVETLLASDTLARRMTRTVLRFLVRRGGAWSFGLLPRFAATAVSGPVGRRSFAPATWAASEAAPDAASLVLLRGRDSSRRVIVFQFPGDARQPAVVIKLWRLPARNANAENEQRVLGEIRSLLDSAIGGTLPTPLGTIRCGEAVAGIESYGPGRPLSHLLGEWGRPLRRKLDDVSLVFDWIGEFHRQARVSRDPWDAAAIQHWVEEPCSRYRSAFGARTDEEGLFAAVRERAQSLRAMPLPIVWAHPDLTGANVQVCRRQITVIDWSGAAARLPLFDLLYFVMLWACRVKHPRNPDDRLRVFRELFVEPDDGDRVSVVVREATARYMKALEINPLFFPLLLVINWVFRSVECFDRAEAVARGDPGANPHPNESYMEYVRILAANTERLFR